MYCPKCQSEVPNGAIFCSNCGMQLKQVCPVCGANQQLSAKFCALCGARLPVQNDISQQSSNTPTTQPTQIPSPLPIQSEGYERRMVTILFADIAGYSTLSEALDPENLLEIMSRAYPCLLEPIQNHDGTVIQVMGDGVLAYFGTPIAKEDDPERAILAGLEIINRIKTYAGTLQEEPGLEKFNVRVGINTGLVVVGDLNPNKHLEYIALGDAVNLAARLQQIAPPDGVLVSHETYRHIQGLFDVIPQSPITVKGRQQITQTYLVKQIRPLQRRRSQRGISGIETPMVGREPEMAALQNHYHDAILGGETALVLIYGDAGIGKTRLSMAFLDWVAVQPDMPFILRGRAIPSTQSVPYGVIRNLFARSFSILETDSSDQAMHKFREGTSNLLDEEQAELVGQLIGFNFKSSPVVQRLFGDSSFAQVAYPYLVSYFRKLAESPVLLLLEDLHWMDDSSLDLITALVEELKREHQSRLMILCTTRPEFFERRAHWAEGIDGITQLKLTRLSRLRSRALIAEILRKVQQIPDELFARIADVSEGNPFFIEELIKMLIEVGVIDNNQDTWQVRLEKLAEVQVPPTLTGILQARIDNLPAAEKLILQRAAVIGRTFWDGLLRALIDKVEAPQTARKATGNQVFICYCREDRAFTDRLLGDLHEYAVETWRDVDNIRGQRQSNLLGWRAAIEDALDRCAAMLIILSPGSVESQEVQAEWNHFSSYKRPIFPVIARECPIPLLLKIYQIWDLCEEYEGQIVLLAKALQRTVQSTNDEADAHLINEHLSALRERGLIFRRESSSIEGHQEYLFKHALVRDAAYETVLLKHRRIFHSQVAAWIEANAGERLEEHLALIASHYADSGQPELSVDWALRAAERAAKQYSMHEAKNLFEQVLNLVEPDDFERRWRATIGHSEALGILGDVEGRHADDQTLLELAQQMGDDCRIAEAHYMIGSQAYREGNNAAARRAYEDALHAACAAGDLSLQAEILPIQVAILTAEGEFQSAGELAEQALEMAHQSGDANILARALNNLALYYQAIGNVTRAIDLMHQQVEITQQQGNRLGEAMGLSNLGYYYLTLGQFESGYNLLKRALHAAQSMEARTIVAYGLLNLGLAEWRLGRPADACQSINDSIARLEQLGDRVRIAYGRYYLGLAHEEAGDLPEAASQYEKATSAFGTLGMTAQVIEAQAGLARLALQQEDLDQAQRLVMQISSFLNKEGPQGFELPMLVYLTCAKIYKAMKDTSQLKQTLEKSREVIQARLEGINESSWREMFVEAIPEHRALLALDTRKG